VLDYTSKASSFKVGVWRVFTLCWSRSVLDQQHNPEQFSRPDHKIDLLHCTLEILSSVNRDGYQLSDYASHDHHRSTPWHIR
jgi:hypothetical protein